MNVRLQTLWITYTVIIQAMGAPRQISAQEPRLDPCPKLPSAREIEVRQRLLETRCTLSRTDAAVPVISKHIAPPHIEWVIQVLALELSVKGGLGWRLYRPLNISPARLPQAAPPQEACDYHFSLFERKGRVWALERWTSRPPSSPTPRSHSLSHPQYATSRLLLSISAGLSDASRWEITPRGVSPSLLTTPLTHPHNTLSNANLKKTHTTSNYTSALPLQPTAQLTPLLGCGRGAAAGDLSSLHWSRRP